MEIQIPLSVRPSVGPRLADAVNRCLDAGTGSLSVFVSGSTGWFRADRCRAYCQMRQPGKLTTDARLFRYDGRKPLEITENGHPHGAAFGDECWMLHTDDAAVAGELRRLVAEDRE